MQKHRQLLHSDHQVDVSGRSIVTQSMTGFARSSVTTEAIAVIVEMRSVNNRFLDLHFRCPDNLRMQEGKWRQSISKQLHRGKIEVSIRLQTTASDRGYVIDGQRMAQLAEALQAVADSVPSAGVPDRLALLQAPGVLISDDVDEAEIANAAEQALAIALFELTEQRRAEGEKLAEMVNSRVSLLRNMLNDLREQLPILQAKQRERIATRVAEVSAEPDGNRLEEELVYLAQRSDVDEEMDRFNAHLDAIEKSLSGSGPCGRRLDFLMQELNREANTLGSKSTGLTTTNAAVEFKVLIEQMREQIQNIE